MVSSHKNIKMPNPKKWKCHTHTIFKNWIPLLSISCALFFQLFHFFFFLFFFSPPSQPLPIKPKLNLKAEISTPYLQVKTVSKLLNYRWFSYRDHKKIWLVPPGILIFYRMSRKVLAAVRKFEISHQLSSKCQSFTDT